MPFLKFSLAWAFFIFGLCFMGVWHRVWFGPGGGALSRYLAGFWIKRGVDEENALKAAEQFLRIATSLIMLIVAVVCFFLIQSMLLLL